MAQKIVLVRHGERLDTVDREWSVTDPVPEDPPLTHLGVLQARCAGERLAELDQVDRVLTSPFYRTAQTANEIASELNTKALLEYGVSECLFSKWFSTDPYPKLRICDPSYHPTIESVEILEKRESIHTPEHPESYEQVYQRHHEFTDKFIVSPDSQGTSVLVAHGATVTYILLALMPDLPKKYHGVVSFASITIVSRDNPQAEWKLECFDDQSHLESVVDRLRKGPSPLSDELMTQWQTIVECGGTKGKKGKEREAFLATLQPQQRAFVRAVTPRTPVVKSPP